jgi:hypothetical protein
MQAAQPEAVDRITPPRGRKVQRSADKPVMYPQVHDFERAETGGRQQNSAEYPVQPAAVMDQLVRDGNREQGAECSDRQQPPDAACQMQRRTAPKMGRYTESHDLRRHGGEW